VIDTEIVVRAQEGDQAAFATLATSSYGRLHRVAQNILGDLQLAEDATQQAMLELPRTGPAPGAAASPATGRIASSSTPATPRSAARGAGSRASTSPTSVTQRRNGRSAGCVTVSVGLGDADDGRRAFHFMGDSTPTLTRSTWDGYLAVRGGSSPTIADNVVTDGGHLSIDGPGETILRDNTFRQGVGTSLSGDARGIVEGNDLTGGSIQVDTGSDISVRGNTIRYASSGNAGAIVVTGLGTTATVSGNTVMGTNSGIAVVDQAEATVQANTLTDNRVGIVATSPDVRIDGNAIRGSVTGVAVTGGTITDNAIEENGTGIRVAGPTPVTIRGNTLCENGVNVQVLSDIPLSLDGNEVCPEAASAG
jgi:parallel beta-helix repeat protein